MAIDNIDKLDKLNTGRVKLNQAIDQANLSEIDSATAIATADTAVVIANTADAKSTTTQGQLDTIVIASGTSDAETIQARGGEPLLYNRLNKVDAELAETEMELKTNVTYKQDQIAPIITFLDDDIHAKVHQYLLPISIAKNVPFSCAVIPGWIDENKVGYMTETQLRDVYDSGYFEMLGHSYSHNPNLLIYTTEEELEYQIGEGTKGWLESRGYEVNGFVYPQGESDGRIRRITKEHYDFAFGGLGINHNKVLDTMNINRIAFGSFTDTNPTVNGNSEKNTLEYYKACVDYAVSNNAWLTFMLHVGVQNVTEFPVLEELIDYIKILNVEILNPTDAHKIHGNKVFMGDVRDNNYFAVNKFGVPFSSNITSKTFDLNAVLMTTPATDFDFNIISYHKISYSHAMNNGFPVALAGYLTTEKYDKFNIGYTVQRYKPFMTHGVFMRYALTDTTWSDWVSANPVLGVMTTDKFLNTTPASSFNLGITTCNITTANAGIAQFPEATDGVLTTYKNNSNGLGAYQEFHIRYSLNVYKRYWHIPTGAWTAWVKTGGQYAEGIVFYTAGNIYLNSTPISTFNVGITMTEITSTNTEYSLFPEIRAGVLTTTKTTSGVGSYQEYHLRAKHGIYKRAWNGTSWSAWARVGGGFGTTAQRPAGVDLGYTYFDTSLGKPVWLKVVATNVWVDSTGATV